MSSLKNLTKKYFTGFVFKRLIRIKSKPLYIALLVTFIISIMLIGCGGPKQEGTVTGFGQSVPSGGGMVQSFVNVELDDGSELIAWLPQDDALWNTMRNRANSRSLRIEIQQEEDYWVYVRTVSE